MPAEKAAEVRAQAGEGRPVVPTHQAEQAQASQAAASSSQQQVLPADSRAQSLHLCGFDISGVSIAGQVGSQQRWHHLSMRTSTDAANTMTCALPVPTAGDMLDAP